MEQLGIRILTFYDFLFRNNLDGSICYHEGQFHVIVNDRQSHIYSIGENPRLTLAMDECSMDLAKVGMG